MLTRLGPPKAWCKTTQQWPLPPQVLVYNSSLYLWDTRSAGQQFPCNFCRWKVLCKSICKYFGIIYFLMNVVIKISVETVHSYMSDTYYSTEDSTRSKVPLLCGIMLLQGQALNSSSSEVAQQAPSTKHLPFFVGLKAFSASTLHLAWAQSVLRPGGK